VLLDTGFSADDVANMRRQFYLSRGEEMPEGLDVGDVSMSISLFLMYLLIHQATSTLVHWKNNGLKVV
jgi:hypothetical protein